MAQDDGPPPLLRTWKRVYLSVFVYLVLLISLLYAFTRVFAY